MFSRREPEEEDDDDEGGRDVFNEKPSAEEVRISARTPPSFPAVHQDFEARSPRRRQLPLQDFTVATFATCATFTTLVTLGVEKGVHKFLKLRRRFAGKKREKSAPFIFNNLKWQLPSAL